MLTLKIDTGSAAFAQQGADPTREENNTARNFECARILRVAAERLEHEVCPDSTEYWIRDVNGNKVANMRINNRRGSV